MTVTGLLLTGGLSTRMKRDKALVFVDERPLWSRQLELLRQLDLRAVFISARTVPPWAPQDIRIVLDHPPSRGPLSGLTAALDVMETSHLLAIAVDLPRLGTDVLANLLASSSDGCGVVPFNDGHFEPLVAVYPREATDIARRALQSNDASLQSFVRNLERQGLVREYSVPNHERPFYSNFNSPDELADPGDFEASA